MKGLGEAERRLVAIERLLGETDLSGTREELVAAIQAAWRLTYGFDATVPDPTRRIAESAS